MTFPPYDEEKIQEYAKKLRIWNSIWTVMWFASGTKLHRERCGMVWPIHVERNDLLRHKILAWYYDMEGFDYDPIREAGVERK